MHAMSAETLRRERDRFVAFAFAAADMLMELDKDGTVVFADGATGGLLGVVPQSLVGKNLADLVISEDRKAVSNLLRQIPHEQRMEGLSFSFFSLTLNAPLIMTASAFHFSRMDNHTFLSFSTRKSSPANDDLRTRDADTGTLNKEAFSIQATEKIREAERKGEKLEITLLDFPQLKQVLDGLQVDQSRKLLEEIGNYLRGQSVGGDLAATVNEASAYSLLHAPGLHPTDVIGAIRSMVLRLVPKFGSFEGRSHTLNAGVKQLTKQDSANALIYTLNKFAESRGEDFTIDSISDGYQELLEDTMQRITSFKDVVISEKFDIAFQPIVDIRSGTVHHFEGLVRLKDEASKDFANPFHFISFGESAGIINEFDLMMTQKTLNVLKEARHDGRSPRISVNLSGRSLSSSLFMDSFHKIIAAQPQVRQQLIVEITESAKIADLKLANNFMQKLRKEGNLICLDDFGSGESSFDYLRSLQVDFIKIDGSYVKEAMQSQHGRDMLRAMAGLCRSLNIAAIGEMVEDEKCAFFLFQSGVRFGQGYFFGKPTTDTASLLSYGKVVPNYPGIMRAKRF